VVALENAVYDCGLLRVGDEDEGGFGVGGNVGDGFFEKIVVDW
jgi:hypothetical protein